MTPTHAYLPLKREKCLRSKFLKDVVRNTSRFAEESGCDVSHVGLLKLVVIAIVPVDVDVVESFNDSIDVETHVDESVDEVFVVSLVSFQKLALIQRQLEKSLTATFAVVPPHPETEPW